MVQFILRYLIIMHKNSRSLLSLTLTRINNSRHCDSENICYIISVKNLGDITLHKFSLLVLKQVRKVDVISAFHK